MSKVGIINPGAMGISIAVSACAAGHAVYWASDGRSLASQKRAAEQQLLDAKSLDALCDTCEIILCVCPPHAAATVARSVKAAGFDGLYCDGNAVSPRQALEIGSDMRSAGIDFVDGSIIGPPAWKDGTTRFYLSGPSAASVADLLAGTVTDAIVIGEEIGRASALKMVFAAQTKGFTALISAILATAENLGVRADLDAEWERRDSPSVVQTRDRVRGVTGKAWRFAGEMNEIAETFEMAGVPNGFFVAAHEVYQRMSQFKDADELPPVEQVLAALTQAPD